MFILPKTIWSRSKNCRCLQSAINNSIDSFGHHNRKQTIKILNKLNRITNNNNHHMTIIILFIHLWILISLPLMIGMFSWTMIPNTKSILIYGWEWIKFQSNNNITIEEDPRQKVMIY